MPANASARTRRDLRQLLMTGMPGGTGTGATARPGLEIEHFGDATDRGDVVSFTWICWIEGAIAQDAVRARVAA